jgi:hypothetical protein
VARYAAATASLRSSAATTFDDTAAAISYRPTFTALASLLLAGVAAVRVDPVAATAAIGVEFVAAITAAGPRPSGLVLKLVAWVDDLGRARARYSQQREHSERDTSKT